MKKNYSNFSNIIFTWCGEYMLPMRGPISFSKGLSHFFTVLTDTFHLSASSFNVIAFGSIACYMFFIIIK